MFLWHPDSVTSPKAVDSDAITRAEAAALLGTSESTVTRLRRHGLLVDLGGWPSYSRADVLDVLENPWLDGQGAADILGVSRQRVRELAAEDKVPSHVAATGRRFYRQKQIEVVARARNLRFHGHKL